MKPDAAALHYIAPVFLVADLSRSLAFYHEQPGFAVEFIYEDFYAGILRDGCRIHLKGSPDQPRGRPVSELHEHIDVCVGVRDAAGLSASFAATGVVFVVSLRMMPYGAEFYVRDPDGNVLGFVQPASS